MSGHFVVCVLLLQPDLVDIFELVGASGIFYYVVLFVYYLLQNADVSNNLALSALSTGILAARRKLCGFDFGWKGPTGGIRCGRCLFFP